jgi:sulfoxide reductase heme-binding subunit YedZ
MLGLFAFFYASLHLLSYMVFDQFFDWAAIWEDIVKRQFITVGMLAFLGLVPLAVTSWNRIRGKMKARYWLKLHRSIYVITGAVVLHYFMMIKADYLLASLHGAILVILLLLRIEPVRASKAVS